MRWNIRLTPSPTRPKPCRIASRATRRIRIRNRTLTKSSFEMITRSEPAHRVAGFSHAGGSADDIRIDSAGAGVFEQRLQVLDIGHGPLANEVSADISGWLSIDPRAARKERHERSIAFRIGGHRYHGIRQVRGVNDPR